MIFARFVGAASSRDKTQRHYETQKGVVHGVSLCGNKADRREKGVESDPFFTKAAISQRDTPRAAPARDQTNRQN